MAENTNVGPAGGNGPALPVTPHVTYGHLDDTPDGGLTDGTNSGDEWGNGPVATGHDFSGAGAEGANGVQPGNGAPGFDAMSGPVEPLGFDPGDNHNDGTY